MTQEVARCEICGTDKLITKCMEHDRLFCLNCHEKTELWDHGTRFVVKCLKNSCNFTRLD